MLGWGVGGARRQEEETVSTEARRVGAPAPAQRARRRSLPLRPGHNAAFCPGIGFHFQPLLGGSHGSRQTFDKEAKYTLELEAWAALPSAWARRSRLRGASPPRPGGRSRTPDRLPAPRRRPRTIPTSGQGGCCGAYRPDRGPLAEEGGAAGTSRVGRCWWEAKLHLAARDVRSPPEPVFPGYLWRPGTPRRA